MVAQKRADEARSLQGSWFPSVIRRMLIMASGKEGGEMPRCMTKLAAALHKACTVVGFCFLSWLHGVSRAPVFDGTLNLLPFLNMPFFAKCLPAGRGIQPRSPLLLLLLSSVAVVIRKTLCAVTSCYVHIVEHAGILHLPIPPRGRNHARASVLETWVAIRHVPCGVAVAGHTNSSSFV